MTGWLRASSPDRVLEIFNQGLADGLKPSRISRNILSSAYRSTHVSPTTRDELEHILAVMSFTG